MYSSVSSTCNFFGCLGASTVTNNNYGPAVSPSHFHHIGVTHNFNERLHIRANLCKYVWVLVGVGDRMSELGGR